MFEESVGCFISYSESTISRSVQTCWGCENKVKVPKVSKNRFHHLNFKDPDDFYVKNFLFSLIIENCCNDKLSLT